MYLRLKFGGKQMARSGNAAPRTPVADLYHAPATLPSAPVATAHASVRARRAGAPRIKTYVAESVPQAMMLARSEMGEEAILIQSIRRDTADASRRFEVTFGVVPGSGTSLHPNENTDRSGSPETATGEAAADAQVARQLGLLRNELASLQTMFRQSSLGKPSALQDNPVASRAYDVLLYNDLDADFAADLTRAIEAGAGSPAEAVRGQLAARIRTDHSVAQRGKAVILMGPPACGKTTALIKLAVEYGLKLGNAIQIFSLTKGKTGADRALEAMAATLDIPCEALADAAALEAALKRPRAEGTLVLVETNGYGLGAGDDEGDLASLLASGENADVHLVLPAAWHRFSIRRTVERFEIFQPARLLFTMADQAAVHGPLIQEAMRTEKPLSFIGSVTAGRIALRPADLNWIVERLFEGAPETSDERE